MCKNRAEVWLTERKKVGFRRSYPWLVCHRQNRGASTRLVPPLNGSLRGKQDVVAHNEAVTEEQTDAYSRSRDENPLDCINRHVSQPK
jgi:hypothetical protein